MSVLHLPLASYESTDEVVAELIRLKWEPVGEIVGGPETLAPYFDEIAYLPESNKCWVRRRVVIQKAERT